MNQADFENALSKLVDQRLSKKEFETLEAHLLQSPEAREEYLAFLAVHDALDVELQSIQASTLVGAPVVPVDVIIRRQRRRQRTIALLAAAAVVLLTVIPLRMVWLNEETSSPALTYRVAPSSSYIVADHATDASVFQLETGARVTLEQGSMELSFRNGVRSVVNGPAEFTLLQDDLLEMRSGVGWFQVPQQAVGFTVRTESLEVVDLGTEFGVLAGAHLNDEVHVFKGKVQSRSLSGRGGVSILQAGEAQVVARDGSLEEADVRANAFLKTLPDTLPYLHWGFDEADADVYRVRGNDPISNDLAHGVYPTSDGRGVMKIKGKSGHAITPIGESGLETDWYGIGGDAPRSVSFWVKLPSQYPSQLTLFGWGAQKSGSDPSCRAFYTYINHGYVGLSFGAHWLRSETRIDDSKWHHVTIVYTGKTQPNGEPEVRFYLDGSREATEAVTRHTVSRKGNGDILVDTAGRQNGGTPFAIFRHNYNAWPNGDQTGLALDELFIFKGALSPGEVDSLYRYNTNLLGSH